MGLTWSAVDLANPRAGEEAIALSNRALATVGLASRSFSLDWRRGAASDWRALRVFILRRGAVPCGLAIFSLSPRPLKFFVGEISLASVAMTRHWHLGEPYLTEEIAPEDRAAVCASLLSAVLATLGRREALFFEGLPVASPLHQVLTAGSAGDGHAPFTTLHLGAPFEHQFIEMPGSFADYVAQLGSRSRQSVLYSQRRLLKDMDGEVKCVCFETEDAVERFLTDATAVSRKTYQWNLLGLGLRDSDALRRKFVHAARAGWWRSFILYCRNVPVAFMLGDQHSDCYYYDDVGYDPDFAKASVGSVLQIMVLEQLLTRSDRTRFFDFSTGYGEHKGRFGNVSRTETNLLVLPATLRNRAVAGAYRANERVARAVVGVVDRLGVKERLKRLIRRRSARAAGSA